MNTALVEELVGFVLRKDLRTSREIAHGFAEEPDEKSKGSPHDKDEETDVLEEVLDAGTINQSSFESDPVLLII